jgi:galactokinase
VEENAVERFIREVGSNYMKKTGLEASFYVSEAGDGGREIIDDSKLCSDNLL